LAFMAYDNPFRNNCKQKKKEGPPENRTASNDCLPYEKDYIFLVVSVDIFEVVSGVTTVVVSTIGVVVTVESVVVVSVLELSLHAANAPIAQTNKSFFILIFFVDEYIVLIRTIEKGNLPVENTFLAPGTSKLHKKVKDLEGHPTYFFKVSALACTESDFA
jgi:hypothetical protein